MRFLIEGAPRTKKNHQRIIRVKGRPVIAQAHTADAWEQTAILQLRAQRPKGMGGGMPTFMTDVNARVLVYRDRAVGDLGNYLAAVCDALERAQVVENDRLIGGFDGSRLLVDRARPRVEIDLTPLTDA